MKTTAKPVSLLAPGSLSRALDGAAAAVGAVRSGTSLPLALSRLKLPRDDAATAEQTRGAVQDLSYQALRSLGRSDALIALLTHKPPPAHVANLLACALPLLADTSENARYAPFTVVDQTVRATAADAEAAFAKGMVNAVLRRYLREKAALDQAAEKTPEGKWNYPAWWVERVRSAWPQDWSRILDEGNARPPLTLRVNQRRIALDAYGAMLTTASIEFMSAGASAITLAQPLPVARIPGFLDGLVSVQDAGAQRAAALLDVHDGMRVLDACAAPGGKTGHLLELADAEVVALDSDAGRVTRIQENLTRLGLQARIVVGDAAQPATWWDGKPFDRLLADVPCSASGIVRRHPDIRWLRRPSDIAALVAEQRRIVSALWPLLASGGQMLYVTCSIFPEEGEQQAQWFERATADAVRLDAPGQLLPAIDADRPGGRAGHDGFFYARFLKR
ncbi:MAG: 16S rRNA (cytosine(967)-C(5))-methyltransferase RsmB [Janthinobacterium lividum]